MIREALDNFQITPNLTENIMREIARIKPAAPSSGKPFTPWAIAASTVAVVLLMLGIGSHQYAIRFQQPYSLDAASEMTVQLIEAPVVLNLAFKPNARTQLGNSKTPSKSNIPKQRPNDSAAFVAEAQTDETRKDFSQWALPKEAKARLGKGGINVLQFSPDGTQLAVGSNIGVWLYDVETGEEISLFAGVCQSLSFSPDGRFLANGGGKYSTTETQVWDITTGHQVSFTDVPTSAAALRFSRDGKRLMRLSNWGDTIHWSDIETGQGNVKGIEVRQLDSGPRYYEAYALTHDKFAVGSIDGKIQLWDTTTGKMLSTLRGHVNLSPQPLDITPDRPVHPLRGETQVLALAFSPDGTHLSSGSKDKTVRLWDTSNEDEWTTLQKHTGWTNVLAFSPDGKMLASGSTDKTVQLWNTATGEPLATLTGHLNGITALAFSPDGKMLASASADGTIRFWNTKTADPLPTRITGHTERVKSVVFSHDGSTLTSAAFNGIITFWNLKTSRKSTSQVPGDRDWFTTLTFSPDGTKLANIGAEGNVIGFAGSWRSDPLIRLTEVSTGHELATITDSLNPTNLTFSPDGKTVAFGSLGKIRLWNTETGISLDISLLDQNDVQKAPHHVHRKGNLALPPGMRAHEMPTIGALAFSPDGTRLVSATMEGMIQMWDPGTGIELTSLVEQDPEGVKYEVKDGGMRVETSYKDPILVLAFSPNGKLLAAGSHQQIRLWNMETGNWGKGITSINSYKEGKYEKGKEVFHGSEALVFSPDNTVLVNGDGNGRIQLFDITTGDEHITLNGHTRQVETLRFSPDGKTLVSAGKDGTILLWDWDEILKGLTEADE